MNKNEFATFANMIRAAYPKDKLMADEISLEVWFRALQDIPYELASAMLTKWIMTNKWAPSIAEIRDECAKLTEGEKRDWSEGWADVLKVISRYGYYRQKEALAALDDVTAECVRRIGWENICMSENLSIERASFRTIYGTIEMRQHEQNILPESVKKVLSGIKLKQIGDGK